MVPPGCKSESSVHFEGRLHSPIQGQTKSSQRSVDSQRLCKPPQEPLPETGFAGLTTKGGSRDGEGSNISNLFQQVIHCSQTKSKMAASLGPQCSKQIFECKNIQDGNPRNNSDFLAARGMGDFAGFQRRLFPHSSPCEIPEISQVPFPKSVLSVPGPSLWPLHSSDGVHLGGQRGQVNGSIPGYKDPPVPRRLVDSSPYQRILPPGHPIPPRPLPGVGLDSEPTKVRARTQTDFRVRGLQVRSLSRTGLTDSEPLGVDPPKVGIHPIQTKLPSQGTYVPNRPAYSNRKTGSPGETPHETHPVAPKTTLESSRIPGKGDKCLNRTALAPFESCFANLYRCLKRRLGCSLRRLHSKRRLVSSRKSSSHKLPGTKSGLTGLEKVPALGTRQSSSSCHRQHHSCGIHQQGRRYEVRLTLCPSMATPVLVQSETSSPKGQTHPGCLNVIADKLSRQGQVIQTEWSLHQGVFDLLVQTWHRPQVDMFATKYNCKLAQYVSPMPDPNAWAVDALTVSWENLDMYVFPPVSLLGKVVSKLSDHLYKRVILIAPGWPNMPWFWDLVELSSQIPLCLPSHPDLVTQPFNKARHRNLTNLNLHI